MDDQAAPSRGGRSRSPRRDRAGSRELSELLARLGSGDFDAAIADIKRRQRHLKWKRLPKRLILLRHGESEGNVNRSVYTSKGDSHLELTPAGLEQAKAAGARLKALIGEDRVFIVVSLGHVRGASSGVSLRYVGHYAFRANSGRTRPNSAQSGRTTHRGDARAPRIPLPFLPRVAVRCGGSGAWVPDPPRGALGAPRTSRPAPPPSLRSPSCPWQALATAPRCSALSNSVEVEPRVGRSGPNLGPNFGQHRPNLRQHRPRSAISPLGSTESARTSREFRPKMAELGPTSTKVGQTRGGRTARTLDQ